MIYFNELRNIS